MVITNAAALVKAGRKDVPLRKALAAWVEKVEAAAWKNIRDVRCTFPAADSVAVRRKGGETIVAVVFNIKGNAYRRIAIVDYAGSQVIVRDVLTHAEYDADAWKGRL